MKFSAFAITTTVATLLSLSGANAAPYFNTQIQNLTENGQDLFFTFDGLPEPAGPATVTIATGSSLFIPGIDLSGSFASDEKYFEAVIDGNSLGFYSCGGPSSVGATVIPGTDGQTQILDCEFSLPLTLTREVTENALSDGQTVLGVLFGPGVQSFVEQDEVVVTLNYATLAPVPLPASLPLVGVGLAGLALVRRGRRS